jgi:hypothetical protein
VGSLQVLVSAQSKGKAAYHAVVCTALAAEEHWLFADAFVDHAVGEHGLARYPENEGSETGVITRLRFIPHFYVRLTLVVCNLEGRIEA